MTIEELAYAADLDVSAVSRIERGLREPRLSTIIALGHALSVWPGELLRGVRP